MMDDVRRLKYCRIIFSSSSKLNLPNITATLAMKYFHTYINFTGIDNSEFESKSAKHLTSILFLACKANESLRSIRDVFNVVTKVIKCDLTATDLDTVTL